MLEDAGANVKPKLNADPFDGEKSILGFKRHDKKVANGE